MTYTLSNCTALAFDLVQRPHGSTAAAIVLTATPTHLEVIAAHVHPQAAADLEPHPRPRTDDLSTRTLMGDPTNRHRLVHTDVLGSSSAASNASPALRAAAADIIAAAPTRAWHAPPVLGDGRVPTWVQAPPADTDLGQHTHRLYQLLYQVASATPEDRTHQRAAAYASHRRRRAGHLLGPSHAPSDLGRAPGGRTHAYALTQLLTVQAYLLGGNTTTDIHTGGSPDHRPRRASGPSRAHRGVQLPPGGGVPAGGLLHVLHGGLRGDVHPPLDPDYLVRC